MSQAEHSGLNHLLAALPKKELDSFSARLELVQMPLGKMLYLPDEQQEYAYFPTTSIVSLHYLTESGETAEMAGVGNEGMVGVSLYMGGKSTSSSAVVQTAGAGFRLDRHTLLQEFSRAGTMQKVLLRYTQALITQMGQAAVCNRHHTVEQRLCRWLLLTLDRLPTNQLVMTQELVANMLGVRREGVTEAAGNLQRLGCISYRRGHIAVLDRGGLEERTCECYDVVRVEMKRLFSDIQNQPANTVRAPLLRRPSAP